MASSGGEGVELLVATEEQNPSAIQVPTGAIDHVVLEGRDLAPGSPEVA